MRNGSYFTWLLENTKTTWWHDSADPFELDRGLEIGASGVTSNPVLVNSTLNARKDYWLPKIERTMSEEKKSQSLAEIHIQTVLSEAAGKLKKVYDQTNTRQGYVCAQVDPSLCGDRESMLMMARRFASWAPNIAVKLPVTSAGLDVLEECTSEGITVTATVSFNVPQVIAVAKRYRKGLFRAQQNNKKAGKCFAVIMIGRIDDYLREVAIDNQCDLEESDIIQAGLAITKRAYALYKKNHYEAVLIVAALRGTYHITELAGAELIMSVAPKYQKLFQSLQPPFSQNINKKINRNVLKKLSIMSEFVRSYEADGMPAEDFVKFGCNQRTLSQFSAAGWKFLEKPLKP